MSETKIRSEFGYVALNEKGQALSTALREVFSSAFDVVEASAGAGRETALARTKLQEASYWAQKAIALVPAYQAEPR